MIGGVCITWVKTLPTIAKHRIKKNSTKDLTYITVFLRWKLTETDHFSQTGF